MHTSGVQDRNLIYLSQTLCILVFDYPIEIPSLTGKPCQLDIDRVDYNADCMALTIISAYMRPFGVIYLIPRVHRLSYQLYNARHFSLMVQRL